MSKHEIGEWIKTKALFYCDAKRVHIEYVLLKKGSVNK